MNRHGLFNTKEILVEKNSSVTIEPRAVGIKSFVHISLKVNIIAQLEFEITYFGAVVPHFNYCTLGNNQYNDQAYLHIHIFVNKILILLSLVINKT